MRNAALAIGMVLAALAEEGAAPTGIRYSSVRTDEPHSIHVMEVDPARARLRLAVAGGRVLGKETPSSMARRHEADAAVNGGFFVVRGPYAGDFEGLLVQDGRILSEPVHRRSSLAFCADGRVWIDQFSLVTEARVGDTVVPVAGINREREGTEAVLYTPAFGPATLAPGPEVVVRQGKIAAVSEGPSPIPADGFVLALGRMIATLEPGLEVHLKHRLTTPRSGAEIETEGCSFVSAGPALIRGGEVVDDYGAESAKFAPGFSHRRHPRTAVGIRKDGGLVFVVVDGRQDGLSVGMTLPELAAFLEEQGAHHAYNLDGGGSSTMILNGVVVNSPSDATGERPSSDAIIITLR